MRAVVRASAVLICDYARLKPALWYNKCIARLHLDVLRNVAILDEVRQSHRNSSKAVFGQFPHNDSAVAGGESGETFSLNHNIEQCHMLAVGKRLWLCCLA